MQRRQYLAALAASALMWITACSSSTSTSPATKPTPSPSPVAGSFAVGGTPADLRLVAAAKEPFKSANPGAVVLGTVSPLGGELRAVMGASVNAELTDYPKSAAVGLANADKLVDHVVAVNRLLVIADPNQTVGGLSLQQLRDIFAGRDTNWNQVGGRNAAITLVGPAAQSATRLAFDKLVMAGNPQVAGMPAQPTPRGVAQLVSTTPGAIGYALASELEPTDTVRRLGVAGIDPTAMNVERGTYPLWFHVHLYTVGPARGAVAAFIRFLTTAKLQDSDAVQLAGFVPLDRVYGVSQADK